LYHNTRKDFPNKTQEPNHAFLISSETL